MARTVFIVDDEVLIRKGLVGNLQAEGYRAIGFADAESALSAWERELPAVVVLDIKLPGMDGVNALREFLALDPPPVVMMITAYATIQTAVETMQIGAFHFLPKPVRFADLLIIIKRAEELIDQRIGVASAKEPAAADGYGAIVHESEAIAKEIAKCRRITVSGATTVLITGDSGTGKELFARALHYESDRRAKPFIEMNCLAIPEALFESELFGHCAGAFTDAKTPRRGLLELADGGSFFLDEISDMPLNLQGKLLKVIEEKEFFMLGRETPTKIDVRFIVSSNRNLENLVENGEFRKDLFYRLNIVNIHLPPLCEHREDIVPLARHFIAEFNRDLKKHVRELTHDAAELLTAFEWPGNVRHLRNVIERIMLLEADEVISVKHLPSEISGGLATQAGFATPQSMVDMSSSLKDMEKAHISRVLAHTGYRREQAARILSIDRKTLYRKMRQYGLLAPPEGAK